MLDDIALGIVDGLGLGMSILVIALIISAVGS